MNEIDKLMALGAPDIGIREADIHAEVRCLHL